MNSRDETLWDIDRRERITLLERKDTAVVGPYHPQGLFEAAWNNRLDSDSAVKRQLNCESAGRGCGFPNSIAGFRFSGRFPLEEHLDSESRRIIVDQLRAVLAKPN